MSDIATLKLKTICGQTFAPNIPDIDELNLHRDRKRPLGCSRITQFLTIKDRNKMIKQMVAALRPITVSFDAIAVSGYSTSLIVPIIAQRLKKNVLLVRKDSEARHSSYLVEGMPDQSYIIIDDMIDSGHTVKFIEERVRTCLQGTLYGIYLYTSGDQYGVDRVFPGQGIKFLNYGLTTP